MIRKGFVLGTVSILIAVFVYWGISSGAKDCGGIPAERVADMVHAVVQSHNPQRWQAVVTRDERPARATPRTGCRPETSLYTV